MNITTARATEILEQYKSKRDLFNWCDEYKQFVNDCVLYCVSYEWDFMLKESMNGNKDSPVNYEELDSFDIDRARDHALYKYDTDEEELTAFANDKEGHNRRVKNKGDFEVFLNSLNKEELKDLFYKMDYDISDAEADIFQWWLISDPLRYRLEQQEEIFLNGAWGRQTIGQSIALDGNVMRAFIDIIKDMVAK